MSDRPVIPPLTELPTPPKRIILHWSGGGHKANSVDLAHYHYVVQGDGTIVAGDNPVAANMRRCSSAAPYAAHTGGFNSYSVGVSCAGMLHAVRGGDSGPYPLTREQIDSLCAFVSLLCDTWDLDPRDPAHVFTHYEAWTLHRVKGARNNEKWDITEGIPHRPDLGPDDVGPWLRERIGARLDRLRALRVDPSTVEWATCKAS